MAQLRLSAWLPWLGLCLLLAPPPAHARTRTAVTNAPPWELGLSPTYNYLVLQDAGRPKGGGALVHLLYQITDTVGLRASASWSIHAIEATERHPAGSAHVVSVDAGLTYAIDLLRLVPRIEVGLGALHTRRPDGTSGTDLGLLVGLGLDYALETWLSVGAAMHYHGFLTDPTNLPVYVDIGPRVALHL